MGQMEDPYSTLLGRGPRTVPEVQQGDEAL